ncbi:MAG: trypsin-like peptidase domain-containing protein [Candidatus Vogelbacteria bacterium]|nr:trypsin-like peptidase domain-containing protein [Candidatus Vogelbacteria bacterium]
MYKVKTLVVIILFCISFVFPIATARSEEITGQSIYEHNKDKICDINTTVHFKDGTTKEWAGTGFFVDKEGHLLTVAHVIKLELANKITRAQLDSIKEYSYWIVVQSRNRKYRAKFSGSIDDADIGMLQAQNIEPSGYSAVKIGDPSKVKVGERDWAIGNPCHLANSLTSGTVSFLHRRLNAHYIDDFIQTDCPINHGNSGCPVFNEKEEVIGIADWVYDNNDGLAFAHSIGLARIDLLKKGEIKPPTTGFDIMLSNFPRDGENRDSPGNEDIKEIEKQTGIEYIGDKLALAKESWNDHSAIITEIDEFEDPKSNEKEPSAAKKAGLEKGDLIISMDDKPIATGMDIRIFLIDKKAGDKIKIVFKRSEHGKIVEKKTELTLTKRIYPSDMPEKKKDSGKEQEQRLPQDNDKDDDAETRVKSLRIK